MPQATHRLVGVVELTTAGDFEARDGEVIVPELAQSVLPITPSEVDGPLASLPEASLVADVQRLCCELRAEYWNFVAGGKHHELAAV
ncbi:MAG: hypothetical protein CMJ64_14580 [Planctomycetaceae bacterium]|jgi:hypothetical protein|nr:hypothetical protein [Planctomycetaceae bacterium]